MKKWLSALLITGIAVSLIGCSTTTEKDETKEDEYIEKVAKPISNYIYTLDENQKASEGMYKIKLTGFEKITNMKDVEQLHIATQNYMDTNIIVPMDYVLVGYEIENTYTGEYFKEMPSLMPFSINESEDLSLFGIGDVVTPMHDLDGNVVGKPAEIKAYEDIMKKLKVKPIPKTIDKGKKFNGNIVMRIKTNKIGDNKELVFSTRNYTLVDGFESGAELYSEEIDSWKIKVTK